MTFADCPCFDFGIVTNRHICLAILLNVRQTSKQSKFTRLLPAPFIKTQAYAKTINLHTKIVIKNCTLFHFTGNEGTSFSQYFELSPTSVHILLPQSNYHNITFMWRLLIAQCYCRLQNHHGGIIVILSRTVTLMRLIMKATIDSALMMIVFFYKNSRRLNFALSSVCI